MRYDPPEEMKSTVAQLIDAVRGKQKLPFTNNCCIHNLAACLAVYESARTRKRLPLLIAERMTPKAVP